MARDSLYDTRKPLISCEFTSLQRSLGVLVSTPFDHKGLNKECVDTYRETITVNTATYGNVVPAEEWHDAAIKMTGTTVDELDKVIKELVAHRMRLYAELEKLKDKG